MMMVESERKRERGGRENGVNVRGNEKGRKIVRVSERERERVRQREIQTNREIQTQRETERKKETERDRQRYRSK